MQKVALPSTPKLDIFTTNLNEATATGFHLNAQRSFTLFLKFFPLHQKFSVYAFR